MCRRRATRLRLARWQQDRWKGCALDIETKQTTIDRRYYFGRLIDDQERDPFANERKRYGHRVTRLTTRRLIKCYFFRDRSIIVLTFKEYRVTKNRDTTICHYYRQRNFPSLAIFYKLYLICPPSPPHPPYLCLFLLLPFYHTHYYLMATNKMREITVIIWDLENCTFVTR